MRLLALATALLVCAPAVAQQVEDLPPLPPLTIPASNTYLPGKVIWADLFTNDVERARTFYEGVFGWEWKVATLEPQHYGLLYNGGVVVAGIAHRDAADGKSDYSRWVHFVSAEDLGKASDTIVAGGGQVLLAPTSHPDRGEFGIYAGTQQEVFGLIRSSAGDPGDYQARTGEWIWWQLFTKDVPASVAAYQSLFDYETDEERLSPEVLIVHLVAHGRPRAAIAPLPPDPEAFATWIGFVRVDDIAATLEKVTANGGEVLLAPDADVLDGDVAVIADPVGTVVGVMRWDYEARQGGVGQ